MNDAQATGSPGVKQVATLGGGCFWCLEAVYDELKGIERVDSGYSGGVVPNPSYQQVSTGTTGHAEVVQITFDRRSSRSKTSWRCSFPSTTRRR